MPAITAIPKEPKYRVTETILERLRQAVSAYDDVQVDALVVRSISLLT